MVIVWDGSWQKMEISLSAHIIISYMALLPLLFLEKVFGKLRHLGGSLSLFGQPLGIGSSREITWVSRGFDFVDWCIMCRCCGETMDHLLLHCRKAYRLWCFVFKTFGISWVPSRTVQECLFSWWNWLGKHSSNIWNLVPLCLMWCIWRERNRRTFEDLDRSKDQLLALFAGSLFDWARAWGLTSSYSIPFFLSSLLLCN